MKLSLVACLLLLVPLALANQAPRVKMLFDGVYGVVLTESFDVQEIRHFYYNNSLHVYALNNDSKWYSQLEINKNLMRRNNGFAVEVHPRDPNTKEGDEACQKQIDEELKSMVAKCFGNLIVRALTIEERSQIIQYRKEQRASKNPFEVIYNKKRSITKSNDIEYFVYQEVDTMFNDRVLNIHARISPAEADYQMQVSGNIVNRSFVVEGLHARSEGGCAKEGLADLILTLCRGKIRVRAN